MTQEEFKQYSELQKKFAKDVERVVLYLSEVSEDYEYVDMFYLRDDGMVETYGSYFSCKWQTSDEYHGSFDAEMLTWTDDELRIYVDQIKKGKEEERAREEVEKARKKEEEERSLWEKLNEKFGKK